MNRRCSVVMLAAAATLALAPFALAQQQRMNDYKRSLENKMESMMKKGWQCKINLNDAEGGKMDVEIRLTMPIADFQKFAPTAGLEAAGIPHKFPTNYIFFRETTTGRVGHVAMSEAEPLAARYKGGEKGMDKEMERIIKWH